MLNTQSLTVLHRMKMHNLIPTAFVFGRNLQHILNTDIKEK